MIIEFKVAIIAGILFLVFGFIASAFSTNPFKENAVEKVLYSMSFVSLVIATLSLIIGIIKL